MPPEIEFYRNGVKVSGNGYRTSGSWKSLRSRTHAYGRPCMRLDTRGLDRAGPELVASWCEK